MNANDFRKELVKIMPGYNWVVHKTRAAGYMSATGTQSRGFNRMSTLNVERREQNGMVRYTAKSAGFGRRARWLYANEDGTLARALRGLQDHYEATANTYRSHAEDLKAGRLQHVRQLKVDPSLETPEQAGSTCEQSRTFVKHIASLKKWGEPDENGKPFEPSDGLDDSHSCLMDLIDEARVISTHASKDVPDPMVKVHPVGKPYEWEEWHISQNLTDRWGDLNYHNAGNKPLRPLEEDSTLLERLRTQMWDEMTFIVRKDGKFGILFEAEFCSLESEEHAKDHDPNWYATLNPHAEVVKALLEKMSRLAERFPAVQFAVPDKAQVVNDRPAAWAFVPDGLLTEDQREELGKALLDL